ncbi:MAG: SURF1 family protein [Candidatus Dadabacteria bacterium]|nr:MAG: SURF1 family protein [Candidatus Dadabacteria bacterium]
MRFKFSLKVTLIAVLAATLMLRASLWQWRRYKEKVKLVAKIEKSLSFKPVPLADIAEDSLTSMEFRRVTVRGTFDYSSEVIVRNRQHEGVGGVYLITPLKLSSSEDAILVNRGFLPFELSTLEKRKQFQPKGEISLVGIIRQTQTPKWWLSPSDPIPTPSNKVTSWLRVNIGLMQKQIPYRVLPVYLEVIAPDTSPIDLQKEIIFTEGGREAMFDLSSRAQIGVKGSFREKDLPIPAHATLLPPGRHYGYVFEWAFMALLTLCGGIVAQLKRATKKDT